MKLPFTIPGRNVSTIKDDLQHPGSYCSLLLACMKKTSLLSSCWILFIIFTLEVQGLFVLENTRELHKSQKNGGARAERDLMIFSGPFLTFIFVA